MLHRLKILKTSLIPVYAEWSKLQNQIKKLVICLFARLSSVMTKLFKTIWNMLRCFCRNLIKYKTEPLRESSNYQAYESDDHSTFKWWPLYLSKLKPAKESFPFNLISRFKQLATTLILTSTAWIHSRHKRKYLFSHHFFTGIVSN